MLYRLFILAVMFGTLTSLSTPAPGQEPDTQAACCDVVKSALHDVQQLKVGMMRREVEEHFEQDGGFRPLGKENYVYRRCAYIHVDVEYKIGADAKGPSPADKVVSVSQPYVAESMST
jgi:hypothetical protein